MRVAIIGCGYVGSAVGSALVRRGHDVVGTTTRHERCDELARLGIRPAVLELAHIDRLHDALCECECALLMVAPGRGATHREVYLEGVRHLRAGIEGTAVRHVVYASSTSVYGQTDGGWVDEHAPTQPAGENGRILVEAEQELKRAAADPGITAALLRLAGIIGPGRGPAKRVVHAAGQTRADGEAFVNLIHRDDIVTACTALVERPYHGVLNLSDGRPVRRREYYDRLLVAAALAPIRWVTPAAPDLGKRVSNRRIVELLGLEPRDAAEASIRDVVESRVRSASEG